MKFQLKYWLFFVTFFTLISCTETNNKTSEPKPEPLNLYSSPTGNYKINFPSTPTVSNEIVPTQAGDISVTLTMHESDQNQAFMVSHADYPSTIIENVNPDSLLLGAMTGALNSLGQTTLKYSKNNIYKNKYPGLSFAAQSSKNYFVIYELYLVKNRLYQIGLLTRNQYAETKTQKDFFSTFSIVE